MQAENQVHPASVVIQELVVYQVQVVLRVSQVHQAGLEYQVLAVYQAQVENQV